MAINKNFSYSTIATAPSPATTGASLTVASGDGAVFPGASFNATVWPANSQPTATNSEIVRVTAISTDTFTITRQQEGTSARTITVGDQIQFGMTQALLSSTPLFNVMYYGAKGDGTTDDSTAIQNAINDANSAGGGIVFFPAGTFLCSSTVTLKSFVNIRGMGQSSLIKTTATTLFSATLQYLTIQDVNLQATGGHVFTIPSGGIANVLITNCIITQNSNGFSIWSQTSGGNMIEVHFSENSLYANGTTRTVPAFNMISTNSTQNDNWFTYNNCNAQAGNGQYFFYYECQSSSFAYNNHFEGNVFEECDGGCIKLLSVANTTLINNWCWDTTAMSGNVIYLGQSPSSGLPTTATTIISTGRVNGTVNGGVKDIYLESTTKQTVIENFRCNPDSGTIELNNAPDVYIVGVSPGTVITNPANAMILNNRVKVLTAGTTPSIDPTLADIFTLTPAQAENISTSSVIRGQRLTLVVTTSGTSSFVLTFGTNFKSTGTLTTGTVSAKVFTISFVSDGTNYNEVSRTIAM